MHDEKVERIKRKCDKELKLKKTVTNKYYIFKIISN